MIILDLLFIVCSFCRLWGDNFFSKKTKKWSKNKENDNERAFNMYILDPIFKLFDAIMNFKVFISFCSWSKFNAAELCSSICVLLISKISQTFIC